MAKKIWRSFNFIIEVAIESPGDIDEEEAAEDAAEFCATLARTAGKVHSSYASVIRVDECGMKRPVNCPVVIRDEPRGTKVKLDIPRGIEAKKDYEKKRIEKGQKKTKQKKKIKRT